ncbi:glycoside hydrolase family 2 protein [Evansella cellulosilytica]|uniref:Glycoside hydrolase family 2 sugar binding protein n=1 Tax=Evansella cellulosilytica (strain ATCC 21833 / DSM 2522 / FERM P-1141 / JCM 9156 / N-4) TaxID=649639 RepID=E6TQD6_EVAC2|nr:glycoside hydrolase family 2 [Evansella cellulosilytica]ADU29314.1 glycoside hydrolase family 2 sugar binding protein [Evansella cellulosilytica DSM 2522]
MSIPRPEYPRPQFVREKWINLNGEWQFDYDDENKGLENKWFKKEHNHFSKKINVPFSYQSELSGIGETAFHDLVWYKRSFTVPADWAGQRIHLHFGAVDYRTWVWVNGEFVTYHEGGHVPFQADITDVLLDEENEVVVRVEDPSKDLDQPRGKQYWEEKSEGIFYLRTTGIWQTVWIEAVPTTFLEKVKMTPDIDKDELTVEYVVNGGKPDYQLEIEIMFDGNHVSHDVIQLTTNKGTRSILLNDFNVHGPGRLWSPENPNLYDINFRIKDGLDVVDEVTSYFGMRKISIENGIVMLNNHPYYMKLVLDQGYFPTGMLTPPSDEDIKNDIKLTKEMGFNGARKHQKIEDPRYLYWADKLGILVWGEMANAYTYTNDAVRRMTAEWQEAVERDYNHPSIVAWVPVNESWGVPRLLSDKRQQDHTLAMYYLTKSLDATRLVISNDGWEHTKSDMCTIHDYESDKEVLKERYNTVENIMKSLPGNRLIYVPGYKYDGEPIQVTEFGGIAYKKSDWDGWGYSGATNDKDFEEKYYKVVSAMLESPLVQGFCYTQLTDVEQEINGLLTYDRKPKIDLDIIKQINEGRKIRRFSTEKE